MAPEIFRRTTTFQIVIETYIYVDSLRIQYAEIHETANPVFVCVPEKIIIIGLRITIVKLKKYGSPLESIHTYRLYPGKKLPINRYIPTGLQHSLPY